VIERAWAGLPRAARMWPARQRQGGRGREGERAREEAGPSTLGPYVERGGAHLGCLGGVAPSRGGVAVDRDKEAFLPLDSPLEEAASTLERFGAPVPRLLTLEDLCFLERRPAPHPAAGSAPEREIFIDNLLVRVHLILEMVLVDRPCATKV